MNEYWNYFVKGIYVDKIFGKFLFIFEEKFYFECGWFSFFKVFDDDEIIELVDKLFGMLRIEVCLEELNSYLGYVFNDGFKESGGLRYCINFVVI